ncbi:MAG: class I SAM-dependent methyltransferase [Zetaproteobacteria bacterium]|nr:class I SAM-dependent methyltransferase [Zetaproteobacteria bacterium]
MGFSSEWEQRYAESTHLSVWPWSDVVSLVHRHCRHIIKEGGRVLELGCGAGANIPLFCSLGMEYFAIEGSPTIVTQLHERYPDWAGNIYAGDFTSYQPYGTEFDIVLDRASLTHNNTESIKRALGLSQDSLKVGGYFIGVDWFSKSHSDFSGGELVDDENTKTNHQVGQFVGTGNVHFSDEQHIRELFDDFEIVFLEEKQSRRFEPQDNHLFASWNIVARKRDE